MLVILQGPDVGQRFPLEAERIVLGRQVDASVPLQAKAVSRQHAQVICHDGAFFIEDLNSANGTFLNGNRLAPRVPTPFSERDVLQIGPYVFGIRPTPPPTPVPPSEPDLIIRQQVSVLSINQSVYGQDPAQKLQVVLEIAQHLANTLELDPLLDKLLDQIMRLFPQSDRSMVLLCEGERLVVRGQRSRHRQDATAYPYSRTIDRKSTRLNSSH